MDTLDHEDQIALARRRETSDDSNLIPLINIVFLLLIFSMVAGQIKAMDGSGIQPPITGSTVGSQPSTVDIQINRENEILLGGQTVTPAQLETVLTDIRQQRSEQILIKADRDVSAKDLGALLKVLRSSGVRNIRLLTQKSRS